MLFERAVKEFGRVDIVVANAAILIAEPIADADAEKWHAVMNVNLFGYFLVTKYACRVMKASGAAARSSTSIPSRARKAARPTRLTRPRNSAASATPRASRWKWRRSRSAATRSAPATCWTRRCGRTRKKGCSSNISRRQSARRQERGGRPPGLCQPGAHETGLRLRRRLQRALSFSPPTSPLTSPASP